MWRSIELNDLRNIIRASEAAMDSTTRRLWELIRVDPAKWQQHPWGDEGGGFWIVGLLGPQVLWYNDIESGFNVSRYTTFGAIDEYWCNQDELHHAVGYIRQQLETGEATGRFGPPEPRTDGGTGTA